MKVQSKFFLLSVSAMLAITSQAMAVHVEGLKPTNRLAGTIDRKVRKWEKTSAQLDAMEASGKDDSKRYDRKLRKLEKTEAQITHLDENLDRNVENYNLPQYENHGIDFDYVQESDHGHSAYHYEKTEYVQVSGTSSTRSNSNLNSNSNSYSNNSDAYVVNGVEYEIAPAGYVASDYSYAGNPGQGDPGKGNPGQGNPGQGNGKLVLTSPVVAAELPSPPETSVTPAPAVALEVHPSENPSDHSGRRRVTRTVRARRQAVVNVQRGHSEIPSDSSDSRRSRRSRRRNTVSASVRRDDSSVNLPGSPVNYTTGGVGEISDSSEDLQISHTPMGSEPLDRIGHMEIVQTASDKPFLGIGRRKSYKTTVVIDDSQLSLNRAANLVATVNQGPSMFQKVNGQTVKGTLGSDPTGADVSVTQIRKSNASSAN